MAFNVNIHSTTPFRIVYYWKNKSDKKVQQNLELLRRMTLKGIREKAIRNVVEKIQQVAVTRYMSSGGGAPKSDIITKRTHNLERAVIDKSHPSHVEKIVTSATGTKFRAVFGVKDDDKTPYASTQEAGAVISAKNYPAMTFKYWNGAIGKAETVSIKPRPYMHPALNDVMQNGTAVQLVDIEIQKIIKQTNFLAN